MGTFTSPKQAGSPACPRERPPGCPCGTDGPSSLDPKPVKAKVDEDGAVVVPDHIVVKGRKRRRVTAPDGRFF